MKLPNLFLARVRQQLSEPAFSSFLKSYNQPAFQGIRFRTDAVPETLKPRVGEKVPWHDGGYYLHQAISGNHPLHHAGAFYIQEPSAMVVVPTLDLQPDDIVLDMAAAPGGKATDIAQRITGTGFLIANDVDVRRAQTLMFNLERMGVQNAIVTQHDPQHLPTLLPHYFDKILIDAPCSGEGMFRKDEDAMSHWSYEHVLMCATRQQHLLKAAVQLLKPGGRIVYSTCTFSPEENEMLIEQFLKNEPEFEQVKPSTFASFDVVSTNGIGVKLWPHLVQGEGHYVAILQHQGQRQPSQKFTHKMKNPMPKEWRHFASENLIQEQVSPNFVLDDRLFMLPLRYQFHRALHTLRAGLFLGDVHKQMFYPSHHLAHVLSKNEVRYALDLSLNDPRLDGYLRGEEILAKFEQGWVLIMVEGFSLGWAKASQGRLKNHYPKGLRFTNRAV
jgi:NOL1/NOP2/sun family putative RNA methylase